MWEDVSEDFKTININHMEVLYKGDDGVRCKFEVVDHAKTVAGLRKIIVPDAYISFFKTLRLKNDGEYVFTNNHGKRLHGRNFSDKLYRLCIKLNIPPKRMHKIRKTVCSKLCDSGVDNRLLLKQIGHTDRRTTETLYHRDRRTDEEKREILNHAISYQRAGKGVAGVAAYPNKESFIYAGLRVIFRGSSPACGSSQSLDFPTFIYYSVAKCVANNKEGEKAFSSSI